jgi:drug/metabolite transporter (DMT)-like permease
VGLTNSAPPERWLGLVFAVVGAVAFSGKAIVVKLGYRYGVDAITLLMYRMLFAMPFFVALAWWGNRQARKLGQAILLTRSDWWAVVGLGFCGYYLASFLDFLGLQYISASLERLILYLNPTLVLLLGVVLFGHRLNRRHILGMLLSYGGVVLVLSRELKVEGTHVVLGGLLVFASAISYAVYLAYSGQWVQRLGTARLVGYASSVACFFCIGQFFLLKPVGVLAVPQEVLVLSLVNAVFCTVIPVVLVMLAIQRVGAGLTAQTGMIGPVSTMALAAVFLDESFTAWAVAGGVLVLLGVALASRR